MDKLWGSREEDQWRGVEEEGEQKHEPESCERTTADGGVMLLSSHYCFFPYIIVGEIDVTEA